MNEPIATTTVKQRLEALAGTVLENSNFNRAFLPTIKILLSKFLEKSTDEDIRKGIIELRDKYIPWVLSGNLPGHEAQDENTSPQ